MQKRHSSTRTSLFTALHGSARYFQRKLQVTRNLATTGDFLQLSEAVDTSSGRGKALSYLVLQASWLVAPKPSALRRWQIVAEAGEKERCSLEDSEVDRLVLKGMNDTLDSFLIFSGAPSSSQHIFRLSIREFCSFLRCFLPQTSSLGKQEALFFTLYLNKLRSLFSRS